MISIIIPTLNEEKYLPDLLKSIKKQSYSDYEIIIADAGSKDKTKIIARRFGCRLVKGGLPAVGRNNGAKIAQGNLLLFLDADVIIEKNFLTGNVAEFHRKKYDMATCYIKPVSKNVIDFFMFKLGNFYLWLVQIINPHAPGFCIFIKKKTFLVSKGFDQTKWHAEDHDLVRRVSKIGKFGILKSKILVSVRRLNKEGRVNSIKKALISEIYLILNKDIKKGTFEYKFGEF